MLFFVNGIDVPVETYQKLEARCHELGVQPEEFVRYLICTNAEHPPIEGRRELAVPRSMEDAFISEGFTVVRRTDRETVLAPTVYMSFGDALAKFQANGLTEDDIVEMVSD